MSDQIPDTHDLILRTALYAKFEYDGDEVWEVARVLFYTGTYDNFCTKCQRDSTFQIQSQERPKELVRNMDRENLVRSSGGKINAPAVPPGVYYITGTCSRLTGHIQYFMFLSDIALESNEDGKFVTKKRIYKIGQFPSYGDVNVSKIKRYSGILSKPMLAELSKAIGLASHGVGVGSYVYLRRIFERLVQEAYLLAQKDDGWDDESYAKARMAERIGMLRRHLPQFLVDHSQMYGLLSRGIHELSEEECLAHFETLRLGIELILDEKLEQRERSKKIGRAKAALAAIKVGA